MNSITHAFDEGETGLGMYILYDPVVKQGDGKIRINSELQKGSEFIIEIKV